MGKGKNQDFSSDEKSGQVKKLKGHIRKLEHEITRLKSELKTYDVAFARNVMFLKTKTTQYSVEELIKGAEAELTLEEIGKDKTNTIKAMTEKWACRDCTEGILKLIIVPGNKYFRKCSVCPKRTELKDYHDNVEGV